MFRRVRKIAKSVYYLRHVCRSAWNNMASNVRIFTKFWYVRILSDQKIQVRLNMTIACTLHENVWILMIISRWNLLRETFSDKTL